MQPRPGSFTLLSGGVGGAKLALGLDRILQPGQLEIIANTGDDFEHLGLPVCPDIDTLIYTLAGVADPDKGWGLANESWAFMRAVEELHGPAWFSLGDRDLETHAHRRVLLREGLSLTAATRQLCDLHELRSRVLPMSDSKVSTHIRTSSEIIDFQNYFVRLKAEPEAVGFEYRGSETAQATQAVLDALSHPDLAAVLIAPSNPWLSIDPILSLSDICSAVNNVRAPVIAVSPVIGGTAVKGPTAKLMRELGLTVGNPAIAEHYAGVIDGLIIDSADAAEAPAVEALGIRVAVTDTLMQRVEEKTALAGFALDFAHALATKS